MSLIFDDRFFTNDSHSTNYYQLKPIITEWSEKITIKEILNILQKVGVSVGEVNTVDKIVEDSNIKLREMIIELHHPKAGTVKIANTPLRLSKTPAKIETTAPLLGQHTEEPDFIIGRTSLSNGSAFLLFFNSQQMLITSSNF